VDATPAPLKLHALGGGDAPPDLGGDLRRLLRIRPEGRARIWQVLGPCLGETISKDTEQLLDVFCSAHGISDDDLGRAIKACRFLVQSAARLDVPRDRFAEDLARLCPDAPVIAEILLAGYDAAKAQIRQALALAAVLGHGKVLVGAEWRVDTIETASSGGKLRVPVAMLTLHTREGQERQRITLQVMPDMLRQLKAMCEQILS
jgi:hypothetical protein